MVVSELYPGRKMLPRVGRRLLGPRWLHEIRSPSQIFHAWQEDADRKLELEDSIILFGEQVDRMLGEADHAVFTVLKRPEDFKSAAVFPRYSQLEPPIKADLSRDENGILLWVRSGEIDFACRVTDDTVRTGQPYLPEALFSDERKRDIALIKFAGEMLQFISSEENLDSSTSPVA